MSLKLALLSFAMSLSAVAYAYRIKKQYYPTVVYIINSNALMAVFYVQGLTVFYMVAILLKNLFFGSLRPVEVERVGEKFWYALLETGLAFAVFKEEFSAQFVTSFCSLLLVKTFHWIIEDRVDVIEQSIRLSWIFHVRLVAVVEILTWIDLYMAWGAYKWTTEHGVTARLVFGLEYALLLTYMMKTSAKYAKHMLRRAGSDDDGAMFLLGVDLFLGTVRLCLFIIFIQLMFTQYTLPLFVIRSVFNCCKFLKKTLKDLILSRKAINRLNTDFPCPTVEDLDTLNNDCIICREPLAQPAHCKKLPCNHIHHTNCLRSWFQRQQTCPTCRFNVASEPSRPAVAATIAPSQSPRITLSLSPPIPQLESLTEEELRQLEQRLKNDIKRRLDEYRDVAVTLNSAAIMMDQYWDVCHRLGRRNVGDDRS